MDFKDIIAKLESRSFSPVYFLEGDEDFFIDKITSRVESDILTEEEKEFNFTVLYGKDTTVGAVLDSCRCYPSMSQYRVVVVKEAQSLKGIEKLSSYFSAPPESTILVLNYRGKRVDKRSVLGKSLKSDSVVHFDAKRLYDNQLPVWIVEYVKSRGLTIDRATTQLISESVGSDLKRLSNELDKLIMSLPKGAKIGSDAVEEKIGISKEFNVFELQTALAFKDVLKANRIAIHLGADPSKNPLVTIVSSLFTFFKRVLIYHYSQGKSNRESVAKALGVNAYFLTTYDRASRVYDIRSTVVILGILREYDLKSKGVGAGSATESELLRELIYKIMH